MFCISFTMAVIVNKNHAHRSNVSLVERNQHGALSEKGREMLCETICETVNREKRYVGDDYFISRTSTITSLNMAESAEQNFERDHKNYLLSINFDEIPKIFVEEETIESFVQDVITKVSSL